MLMEPEKEKPVQPAQSYRPVTEDSHVRTVNQEATRTTTTFSWRRVGKTIKFPLQVEVPCLSKGVQANLWQTNYQVEVKNLVALGAATGVDIGALLQNPPTLSTCIHLTPSRSLRWPEDTQAAQPPLSETPWNPRCLEEVPKDAAAQTEARARTVATQVQVKAGCPWAEGYQRIQDLGLPREGPTNELESVAAHAAAGWTSPGTPRPRLPSLGWNPENRAKEPLQDPVVLEGEVQVIQAEVQDDSHGWEEEETDQDLAAAAEEVERSMTEEDGSWEAMDLSGELAQKS